MIYHIVAQNWLDEIRLKGVYQPDSYATDGFIHCSTAGQVANVANRFYANQRNLILLEIDETKVTGKTVYENLEGGIELFPHVYGTVPRAAILRIGRLVQGQDGFTFPDKWSSPDEYR